MPQLQFSFDSFSLSFNEKQGLLHLEARRAPEGVWPPHLRPIQCGGIRAHHLSLPWQPRNSGPHKGKFWPHLTYLWRDAEGKERKAHHPLAVVGPEAGAALNERFESAMRELVDDLFVPVTEEELWAERCTLVRMPASLREQLKEKVARRGRFRLLPEQLEQEARERPDDFLERVSPEALAAITGDDIGPDIQVLCSLSGGPPQSIGFLVRPPWMELPPRAWAIMLKPTLDQLGYRVCKAVLPPLMVYAREALREMQADVPRSLIDQLFHDGFPEREFPSFEEFYRGRYLKA